MELWLVLAAVAGLVYIGVRFHFSHRHEQFMREHLPWLLLVAFRGKDSSAGRMAARIRRDILFKFDRDYTVGPKALLALVRDTVEAVGRAYNPEEERPLLLLTSKQLNDLSGRIIDQLNQLFSIPPFNLLTGIDVAAVRKVEGAARAVRENEWYRAIADSPVGRVMKNIPFLKLGQAVRLSRKVVTPMGMMLEAGRMVGMEAGKRILLKEVSGIAAREAAKTFSGGEAYDDKRRVLLINCWLASRLIAACGERRPLEWLVAKLAELKGQPALLPRYILAQALAEEAGEDVVREIIARARQSRKRLPADHRRVPGVWRAVFRLESLQQIYSDFEKDQPAKQLREFLLTLPPDSAEYSRLESLLPGQPGR